MSNPDTYLKRVMLGGVIAMILVAMVSFTGFQVFYPAEVRYFHIMMAWLCVPMLLGGVVGVFAGLTSGL